MIAYSWYKKLKKPFFAPPAWLFGPVWTVLYIIIFVSYGYLFYLVFRGQVSVSVLIPFVINLIANLSFTPIQFGLRNNELALIDILIVDTSLIWAMAVVGEYSALVFLAQLPYLIWTLFATILQVSVTLMNR